LWSTAEGEAVSAVDAVDAAAVVATRQEEEGAAAKGAAALVSAALSVANELATTTATARRMGGAQSAVQRLCALLSGLAADRGSGGGGGSGDEGGGGVGPGIVSGLERAMGVVVDACLRERRAELAAGLLFHALECAVASPPERVCAVVMRALHDSNCAELAVDLLSALRRARVSMPRRVYALLAELTLRECMPQLTLQVVGMAMGAACSPVVADLSVLQEMCVTMRGRYEATGNAVLVLQLDRVQASVQEWARMMHASPALPHRPPAAPTRGGVQVREERDQSTAPRRPPLRVKEGGGGRGGGGGVDARVLLERVMEGFMREEQARSGAR